MGGVTTPALAAAVASAGGLGMVAAAGLDAGALRRQVRDARAGAEGGRIGVNFLMPFLDLAAVEVAAVEADVVECFYGGPDPGLVETMRAGGAVAAWQVGSADEARRAVDAGCQLVVAQGVEAGGHVRGRDALLPLLGEVLAAVDVPVVAAGGIATNVGVRAALSAGADGVRVGTRFLAAVEADVHPDYLVALVAAGPSDTVLTEAFAMGWPDAPHRVLATCVAASDADPATRSPLPPTGSFRGDVGAAALYAGQSVGGVRLAESAAAIVTDLAGD